MNDDEHRPGPGDFDQSLEDFVRDLKNQFQPIATPLPRSEPPLPYPVVKGSLREWRERVLLGLPPLDSSEMLASRYPSTSMSELPREEEDPHPIPAALLFRPEEYGFLHPPGWVPDLPQQQGATSSRSALAREEERKRGKGNCAPVGDGEDSSLDQIYEAMMNSAPELPQREATSSATTSSPGTGAASGSGSGWGLGSSSDSTPKKPGASIFGATEEIVDPFGSIYSCEWSDVYYRPSQRSHAHGGESVGSRRWIARDGSGTSSL